ncbi:MAG: right-handed parallel beta-helix repeat-containing protein, partial [Chlamydiales bacterium]|nr:right-handed parallel beta-helix repeat-containing protein [Chlamydiales bacterium]
GIQSHWGFESVGLVFLGIPRPQRGVVKDCHVLNMPTAFVANASDNIIFENCTATAGNLPGVAGINSVGFQCTGTSNGITFKNCISTGFTSPTSASGNGFRASSGSNINILDCVATKNAQGISVASGVTLLVADSNEVAFNTNGVLDTTAAQTPNLYTRNVAFANTTNYSVNTANPNFVVVQASQAAGYPLYTAANASPLSNFSLQP